ncbi:MFS transporter [Ammoniphilus resinae]|uniref:MFS family permease n=1 Tax=Ammoniphilus resinae TaxID=861532 RepID=A0ABS4GL96_9BACL|nr:MFS transporter [Ammoniphilus resinae]MBP1931014.1 MFS family permease [Ammoniphilus resinae]
MKLAGKWYFGWNIVVITALITLLTVGTRLGASPFFKPMLEDLGVSRTVLSSIISVGMLVYGIGMPLAGYLVGKYGTRFVLLVGVALITGSIVWTISTTSLINFTLGYGIFLSLGLAFTSPIAVTPVVSRWFTRQRGKALFCLATGSMGGIAIMTPAFTFLIDWVGWQNTLLLLAIVFVVLIVPSALFVIRDEAPPNTDLLPGQIIENNKKPQAEMIKLEKWTDGLFTRPYWQISLGLFVCGFSMNLLGSHGVTMLTDHGFHEQSASFGIGLIGLVAVGSTLVLGELSDRIPKHYMLSLIYGFRGLGFLSLVLVMSSWQLYAVSIVGGLVWAGSNALSSAILGNIYGLRHLGVLYGWSYFIHQIGGAVGVFVAGWGFEVYGTHMLAFGGAAGLLILASIVCLRLPDFKPLEVMGKKEVSV